MSDSCNERDKIIASHPDFIDELHSLTTASTISPEICMSAGLSLDLIDYSRCSENFFASAPSPAAIPARVTRSRSGSEENSPDIPFGGSEWIQKIDAMNDKYKSKPRKSGYTKDYNPPRTPRGGKGGNKPSSSTVTEESLGTPGNTKPTLPSQQNPDWALESEQNPDPPEATLLKAMGTALEAHDQEQTGHAAQAVNPPIPTTTSNESRKKTGGAITITQTEMFEQLRMYVPDAESDIQYLASLPENVGRGPLYVLLTQGKVTSQHLPMMLSHFVAGLRTGLAFNTEKEQTNFLALIAPTMRQSQRTYEKLVYSKNL